MRKLLARCPFSGSFLLLPFLVLFIAVMISTFLGCRRSTTAVTHEPTPAAAPLQEPPIVSSVYVRNVPGEIHIEVPVFFLEPITMDPYDILSYPMGNWRDSRFEVFRWDRFPEILIFDTATFAVQDRLLKRLAFFVEKAGFRGRLAHDAEIAGLHGWNAHDYKAEDLAIFFETARRTNFPLSQEERDLESILLAEGTIRRNVASQIIPGRGAILSISRGSDANLRTRFMAHEGFHGIYFIDEDLRNFTRERWEIFPDDGKAMLLAFFHLQEYDITNTELVLKEFKAHVLQLPVGQLSWYFGIHLPNRLLTENAALYRDYLPAREELRDGRRLWPDLARIFTAEAEVFSRYVDQRWGFAAGRVWRAR